MGGCCCSRTNDKLDSKYCKDLKIFTYAGHNFNARVTDVYDGDTITIVFFDKEYKKMRIRLAGIDTPELKPRLNIENRDLHIAAANICKEYVSSRILDKIIYVEIIGEDKYGRLLGNIYIDNKCINTELLDNNLAIKYDGKTKLEFTYYFIQGILLK
jgi:endonuclease YncB( thermonuclease family)